MSCPPASDVLVPHREVPIDWQLLRRIAWRQAAGWAIPGYDREDLSLEVLLVLHSSLERWNRRYGRGHEDRYYHCIAPVVARHHLIRLYRRGPGARQEKRRRIACALSLDELMHPGEDDRPGWEPADPTTDPDRPVELYQDAVQLCGQLLASLPQRHRIAVKRLYLEGVPVANIAAELGCERHEVRRLCDTALAHLRAQVRLLSGQREAY